jgi:hypothetical protein
MTTGRAALALASSLALVAAGCSQVVGADDYQVPPDQPECTEQADCNTFHSDGPYACVAGACKPLLDDQPLDGSPGGQCRVVLGKNNLASTQQPFVFGAFAAVSPGLGLDVASQDFELAVDEFTANGGMIVGGETRLPVGVVCNAFQQSAESLDRSLDHLVNGLQVNAVISSIPLASELKRAFEHVHRDQGRDVFFLSPFQSDPILSELDDDGLVWQMLGQSRDVAALYPPLLRRVEEHLKAADYSRSSIRLALLDDEAQPYLDMASLIDRELVVNGKSAGENGAEYYRRFHLSGDEREQTVLLDLVAFEPDVVIAMVGMHSGTFEVLERYWSALEPPLRPFYLPSPVFADDFLQVSPDRLPSLRTRVAGVNAAGAPDPTLYDAYVRRFESHYPGVQPSGGHENFYDAAYFLLYAASAARDGVTPSGPAIAAGMQRLLSGTSFEVGGEDIASGQAYLQSNPSLSLQGTLGPPDFDVSTGSRLADGSVWCIAEVDGEFTYHYDVLRLDRSSGELYGDFDCFDL